MPAEWIFWFKLNKIVIKQTFACVSLLDMYVSNQPCVWFHRANFSKSIELKTKQQKRRRKETIKFQCKETISLCKPFNRPKTYYFYVTNKTKTELNGSLTYQPQTQGRRVWTSEWGFEKATLSTPRECTALTALIFNACVMCIYIRYLCWPIDRYLCGWACAVAPHFANQIIDFMIWYYFDLKII